MTAPSSRLTSKAGVVLLALVGAGLLLVSGSRTWVSGTVDDAVLGSSRVTGSGSDVASGVVALALAGAAAAIAATTSGRVVRRVVIVVLALAVHRRHGRAAAPLHRRGSLAGLASVAGPVGTL